MSGDVIVQIRIGGDVQDFPSWSSWNWSNYASDHDALFFKVTGSDIDPHFAKFEVLDKLDKAGINFRRVAVVDYDTLVRRRCPWFLGNVGDGFYAVPDLGGWEWIARACRKCYDVLGEPYVQPCSYFNTGVIVLDETHRDFCQEIVSQASERATGFTVGDFEQTFVNWLAFKHQIHVPLSLRFNFTKPRMRGVMHNGAWQHVADVLHFNETIRNEDMAKVWQAIRKEWQ